MWQMLLNYYSVNKTSISNTHSSTLYLFTKLCIKTFLSWGTDVKNAGLNLASKHDYWL